MRVAVPPVRTAAAAAVARAAAAVVVVAVGPNSPARPRTGRVV